MPGLLCTIVLILVIVVQDIYIYVYSRKIFPFFILPLKFAMPNKDFFNRHENLVKITGQGAWSYMTKEDEFRMTALCKTMFPDIEAEYKKDFFIIRDFKKKLAEKEYKPYRELFSVIINFDEETQSNEVFEITDSKSAFKYLELSFLVYRNKNKKKLCVLGLLRDISNKADPPKYLKNFAYEDRLTGLYSRYFLKEYFLGKNLENLTLATFVCIRIDNLKYMNDAFGYDFGDKVIKEIAKRIRENTQSYVVCRFDGDKFIVFVENYINEETLKNYLSTLKNALVLDYNTNNLDYTITCSIGVSLYPEHGKNYEELLKSADIALSYSVKDQTEYSIYNKDMFYSFQEKLEIEKELKEALKKNNELELFYQPQYNIKTGELYALEALLRWKNHKRGLVMPSAFIPIIENTKIMDTLGLWVIEETCNMKKHLENTGFEQIRISANLSTFQLINDDFVKNVSNIVEKTNINANYLELEVSESILIEAFDSNIKKLRELKDMGISIALDDFGTGYSSLIYLKLLPISTIKIDKRFIETVSSSETDRLIVQEIIHLSHILNLTTVAEGVETVEELAYLDKLGCDIVQGYIGGKPMTKDDILSILNKKLLQSDENEL